MAGAAERLGVNHSTVFRRLEAFEAQIDTRLFERSGGEYRLTPAGDRLLPIARSTDAAIGSVHQELLGESPSLYGAVRVVGPAHLLRAIGPAVIRSVYDLHPNIHIELLAGNDSVSRIDPNTDIVLAVSDAPLKASSARYLMTMEWSLWVHADLLRSVKEGSTELSVMAGDAYLATHAPYHWLERHHGDAIVARTNDTDTMIAFAKQGLGAVVLPDAYVSEPLVRLQRVPGITDQLWLSIRSDAQSIKRVQWVADALASVTKSEWG